MYITEMGPGSGFGGNQILNFNLLRIFLFIFNSFLACVYYHSQFGKKKLASDFYDYDLDRSICVIRIFFLDRRIWNFKDFELSCNIFFSRNFRIDSDSFRLVFYSRLVLGFFKSRRKSRHISKFSDRFLENECIGFIFYGFERSKYKSLFC